MKTDLMKMGLYTSMSDKIVNLGIMHAKRIIQPVAYNIKEWTNEHVAPSFKITGHYDSYINKACVEVLEKKYLSAKYETTLFDVDPSFALCTASLDRVKRKVSCFPDLVNKTIKPGVWSLVMDDMGTRMIVIKEPILNKDDRSDNGILSNSIVHFSTTVIFVGVNKMYWFKKVRKEIDEVVSGISKSNQNNGKLRYNVLSANDTGTKDIRVRNMESLEFPAKDALLELIHEFRGNEKIYEEYGIPYRKGILLGGAPGVGKTAFAFALATHFEMDCVSVNLDIFDTKNGDEAFKASNTVFVIDEIDSQIVNRATTDHKDILEQNTASRRLLQLLRAMDGMDGGSIVVATTNFPEKLDPALVRSGRFDHCIEMGDIPYDYAVKMCKNRGCDPDILLAGKTFPYNPARLEQECMEYILKNKNIGQNKRADLSELGIVDTEYVAPDTTGNKTEEIKPDPMSVSSALTNYLATMGLALTSPDSATSKVQTSSQEIYFDDDDESLGSGDVEMVLDSEPIESAETVAKADTPVVVTDTEEE